MRALACAILLAVMAPSMVAKPAGATRRPLAPLVPLRRAAAVCRRSVARTGGRIQPLVVATTSETFCLDFAVMVLSGTVIATYGAFFGLPIMRAGMRCFGLEGLVPLPPADDSILDRADADAQAGQLANSDDVASNKE